MTAASAMQRAIFFAMMSQRERAIEIEDDTLNVSAGESVNLRARLNRRPSQNVVLTLSFSGNAAMGNSQTFNNVPVRDAAILTTDYRWQYPLNAQRPAFNTAFGASRYFNRFSVLNTGVIRVDIESTSSGPGTDPSDLSAAFENSGQITVVAGGQTLTVELAGAVITEPYIWTPQNSAQAIAFYNALRGTVYPAAITFRDFNPTPFLTVAPANRTFTPQNWNQYQSFALSARAGSGGNSPTVDLSAAGGGFDGVTDDATVAIAA